MADLIGGAFISELVSQLYILSEKAFSCRDAAKNLAIMIGEIQPTMEEILNSGVKITPNRQAQLRTLSENIELCKKLTVKVLKCPRWNKFLQLYHTNQMEDLHKRISTTLNNLSIHVYAEVHHHRIESEARFDRIEKMLQEALRTDKVKGKKKVDEDDDDDFDSQQVATSHGELPSKDEHISNHQRLFQRLQIYGFVERKIQRDGNCQFRSLSDQLYRTPDHYKFVRQQVVNQLKGNPEMYEGCITMAYADYLTTMERNGEWGDQVTLQAAADCFGVKICVLTALKDTCYIEIVPHSRKSKGVIFLSVWSDVHYNSIYIEGEVEDESWSLDSEVGKPLNQMIHVDHVPTISGELPSQDEQISDRERLLLRLQLYDLVERKIQRDGNCQFRSLADQLYRSPDRHKFVRQQIVHQLKRNPKMYEGCITMAYADYLTTMKRNGEWGDRVTLQAAADCYGVRIFLITSFKDTCYIEILPHSQKSDRLLYLSFWDDVHYNSIFPKGIKEESSSLDSDLGSE